LNFDVYHQIVCDAKKEYEAAISELMHELDMLRLSAWNTYIKRITEANNQYKKGEI